MKSCMFLYFHGNFKPESTKTCLYPYKFSFSAYFYPMENCVLQVNVHVHKFLYKQHISCTCTCIIFQSGV